MTYTEMFVQENLNANRRHDRANQPWLLAAKARERALENDESMKDFDWAQFYNTGGEETHPDYSISDWQ